jgi:mxaJ protein
MCSHCPDARSRCTQHRAALAGCTGAPRVAGPRGRTLLLLAVAILGVGAACAPSRAEPVRELRVCSDPNNLPFSNEAEEGFENRIAEILAEELGAEVRYTWWAQRRGFIRNTLRANECDVVMGVPSSFELALPTRPYYRSTYVFVYPAERVRAIRSLDDAALREVNVGVHLVGDDYNNTPPAEALANRGFDPARVKGFTLYGDYSKPNPPARIFDALVTGEIDVAIVWGPFAGYFVPRLPVAMEVVPVRPQIDPPYLPFVFDISLGVRREESEFAEQLDGILIRRQADIRRILDEYGVPQIALPGRTARRTGAE